MKYLENRDKLNFINCNGDICEVVRGNLYTIEGVPIRYNKEFILLAYNYDFEFDGYKIIMLRDIDNIKYDEVDIFISNILKVKKLAQE